MNKDTGKTERGQGGGQDNRAFPADTLDAVWSPQPGPQALALTCPADIIFFGGARGGGKSLANSAGLLTSKGWRPFGNVSVGDTCINPETGGSQSIIGVFPQGKMDIYRVIFDDGAVAHVTLDHLWTYKCANRKRPGSKKSSQRDYVRGVLGLEAEVSGRYAHFKVGTTQELMSELERGGHNPRIPLTAPVCFSVNGRTGTGDVPAYLLGLMLGDGTFAGSSAGHRMTVQDPETASYLMECGFAQSGQRENAEGVNLEWYLPTSTELHKKLTGWCTRHGLKGKAGKEKFVPDYVFTANIEYRLEFLQGLLDSDGYVDSRGHVEFTSISDSLVYGVQDLVRSLGGKATVSDPVTGTYRDPEGNAVECQSYRRVYIQSNVASKFFKLSRKSQRCTDSWNGGHENMRKVVSIEYSHREEATCIKVSSPHGLFVTDDYIVTHNTDCAIGRQIRGAMVYGESWSGLFVRKNFKHFKELRRRIDELINRGLDAKRSGGDQATNIVRFGNGASIIFTAIQYETQLEYFQGQQYCVARGTRITMADGSPKRIDDIEAGDMVHTLEGPRRVVRKMPPRVSPCVKVSNEFGSQINPEEHPILSGYTGELCDWFSFSSLQAIDKSKIVCPICEGTVRRAGISYSEKECGEIHYIHPYTGAYRVSSELARRRVCFFEKHGDDIVYDLTVEGVNHYISYDTGIINKNTELSIEEGCQFPFIDNMIEMLKGCLRSPHGVPTHMFITGNPGGPGHGQVKARFISPAAPGTPIKDEGGDICMFVPSSVEDNKVLVENDPKYVRMLKSIRNPELRKAWLEGDWDVVAGGFFSDLWQPHKLVLRPFQIPKHWDRVMGFDWGSAKPFSVGWWAVSGGEFIPELGRALPRGSLVRYYEWYGCVKGQPDVGLRLNSANVAKRILELEDRYSLVPNGIIDRIADPAVFKQEDGKSVGESMADCGVVFRRGDNKRVPGWDAMRSYMRGVEIDRQESEDEEGNPIVEYVEYQPQMYIFETCAEFIRTVPILARDDHDYEDIDTTQEDHIADEPLHPETVVHIDRGYFPIKDIPRDGYVYTIGGELTPYYNCRITRRNAGLVEIEFEDGQRERCCPTHEFLTNEGFVSAQGLTGKTVLANVTENKGDVLCYNHASTGRSLFQTHAKSFAGESTINKVVISRITTAIRDYIVMSGSSLLEKVSLMGSMFTMKTAILSITSTKTLSLSKEQSITGFTYSRERQKWTERNDSLLPATPGKQQKNGTIQRTDDAGISGSMKRIARQLFSANTRSNVASVTGFLRDMGTLNSAGIIASQSGDATRGLIMKSASVSGAEQSLKSTSIPGQKLAQKSVRGKLAEKSVKTVRNVDEVADVYCMTVPETEIFEVRGGLLTHNCRYVAMSRQGKGRSELDKQEEPTATERDHAFIAGTTSVDAPDLDPDVDLPANLSSEDIPWADYMLEESY